jgi:hypothetical protein
VDEQKEEKPDEGYPGIFGPSIEFTREDLNAIFGDKGKSPPIQGDHSSGVIVIPLGETRGN